MAGALSITHEPAEPRGEFVLRRDSRRVGELTYSRAGARMVIHHTGVNKELRGTGEARRLVEAAVQLARKEQLTIASRCSYASKVLAETPGYRDVLAG